MVIAVLAEVKHIPNVGKSAFTDKTGTTFTALMQNRKKTRMTMSDLIDRDALMKEFTKFVRRSNNHDNAPAPTWNDAVSLVGSMPSAESERTTMVWKPAKGRPVYESGICSCGYVLTVLQKDFIYCPHCGLKLEWGK